MANNGVELELQDAAGIGRQRTNYDSLRELNSDNGGLQLNLRIN